MPVELPQTLWFKSNKGSSNGLANGKVGRVNLVELSATTWNTLGLVLESAVDEGRISRELAGCSACHLLGADGAIDNIGVGSWELVKD